MYEGLRFLCPLVLGQWGNAHRNISNITAFGSSAVESL
jgi:hypothetical protein